MMLPWQARLSNTLQQLWSMVGDLGPETAKSQEDRTESGLREQEIVSLKLQDLSRAQEEIC